MDNLFSDFPLSLTNKVAGTILVFLSGIVLYLDQILRLFNISSSYTFGFSSFSNFLWAFTQSVAPLLLIIASYFKPYKIIFLVPIYCYGLQLLWTFGASHSDDPYGYFFALGFSISFFLIIFLFKKTLIFFKERRSKEKDEFVENTKDVIEILKSRLLEESK
ncbi:hypothetical protein [Aquimarina rhabdastrellae]